MPTLTSQIIKAVVSEEVKYFNAENPNLSEDERKKKFDEWLIDQVKDLSKAGVLGHIHLSDNFGFEHTKLPMGMGNFPTKEVFYLLWCTLLLHPAKSV